jgi:E3 ubiquitin-protein ligase RNF115/126
MLMVNSVLVGLMAAFGEPPGGHGHPHPFHGPDDEGNGRGMPFNPFLSLFAQMGNGQFGDAVYSQEALDRIISQLMEQNATSNAPGPASQDQIGSLPRKNVTVEMLGPEGRAECSICMEEVNIGEEVAELPCHHWFHHACVAAWLGEHDTCPHCRKGITKPSENPNPPQATHPGPDPTSTMPGAFAVSGEGTSNDPYTLGSSPPTDSRASHGDQQQPNSSGGGVGDRMRRSWFG